MRNLVCIFYLNFQMRFFTALAVHATAFGWSINFNRFNDIATKMQVQRKASCRNQIQQQD